MKKWEEDDTDEYCSSKRDLIDAASVSDVIGMPLEAVNFSAFDNMFVYSEFQPPTGFHWNTNYLAFGMMMTLPFFLCSKATLLKVFGILSITLIVIMSASRAVFLAMLLLYFLYLFLIKKRIGTLTLILIISSDVKELKPLAHSLFFLSRIFT